MESSTLRLWNSWQLASSKAVIERESPLLGTSHIREGLTSLLKGSVPTRIISL